MCERAVENQSSLILTKWTALLGLAWDDDSLGPRRRFSVRVRKEKEEQQLNTTCECVCMWYVTSPRWDACDSPRRKPHTSVELAEFADGVCLFGGIPVGFLRRLWAPGCYDPPPNLTVLQRWCHTPLAFAFEISSCASMLSKTTSAHTPTSRQLTWIWKQYLSVQV